MRKYVIGFAPVAILTLIGWGIDLWPNIESYIPSIIVWAIAGLWLVATLIYLALPKLRRWRRDKQKVEAEIFEIEVPQDILHKVIGTPPPEGRTLDIKGKWVKRKIPKTKEEER